MDQPGNAELNSMIRDLAGKKYLSLTTFRRNGAAVSTPVEFVERDGMVYIKTSGDSGKVKRIKHNPAVRIAPCTIRGRLLGPPVDAVASLVSDDAGESILQLFRTSTAFSGE